MRNLILILGISLLTLSCSDNPVNNGGGSNGGGDGGGGSSDFNHSLGPGQSSAAFLRAGNFDHLYVELDYVESFKPTDQAVDSLQKMLDNRLHKPGGITLSLSADPIGTDSRDTYTPTEIRELEEEHRDQFTQGDTLSTYFIFLNGSYQQENVLGIAYYNTSMAIFEEKIRDNSGGLGQPPRYKIEATVLNHEFGHILGLVGNGTPVQSNHKTDNSAHCTTDNCLMRPSVNTSDFFANVFDGSIPDFKSHCLTDLQEYGGK